MTSCKKIDSAKDIDYFSNEEKEEKGMEQYSEAEEEFITFFLQKYGQ